MMKNPKQRSKSQKGFRKPLFRYAFFGTGTIAEYVLEELERAGLIPTLVVTAPDKPRGRGLASVAPSAKTWAQARGIEVLQPEKFYPNVLENIGMKKSDVFVVVDYGKLLPKEVLAIPRRGALNMHPSLLPRLRGPSPIRSAILNDERQMGVSIMLVDDKMDHGPIVAQKKVDIAEWPPRGNELDERLARQGGVLLAQILPLWVSGQVEARPQNHDLATYSDKFSKEDGLLDLKADPYKNLLKIRAYEGWPGTFAFFERGAKKIRVQILDAHLDGGKLVLDRVKPEGKKEMSYADFIRSGATPL